MKTRLITAFIAAFALASCSHLSDKTTLNIVVEPTFDDYIRVCSADVDTVVYAEGGMASLQLPADVMSLSMVQIYSGAVAFISDGSSVTVDFTQDQPVPSSSAKGPAYQYGKYMKTALEIQSAYSESMSKISEDESISEDERYAMMEKTYDEVAQKIVDLSRKTISANRDNAVALVALEQIYGVVPSQELLDIVSSLSPELQKNEGIQSLMMVLESESGTAEGKMFTDFSVTYGDKVQNFSDYIGKGKYVLVDFWASWCAPCKAEIPNLKNVYEKYHGDQFDILSVAVWDEPQATVDTAAVYQIPWNQIINAQQVPTDIYGISGIPHIILFGPDGTILKRGLRGEQIGETVGKYIK